MVGAVVTDIGQSVATPKTTQLLGLAHPQYGLSVLDDKERTRFAVSMIFRYLSNYLKHDIYLFLY